MNIGFIGAGNMAKAMITGLLDSGYTTPEHLFISNRSIEKLESFARCHITLDNTEVAKHADVLVLSIKPQVYEEVILQIRDVVKDDTVVVAIAPNWTLETLEKTFARPLKMIRCMPNTPAMVQEGMTGYVCNALCTKEEEEMIVSFCQSFGQCVKVEEDQMDAVVALSGSSPAYAFSFLDAMIQKGMEAGLTKSQCTLLAGQALKGAAQQVLESEVSAFELKERVCSPNGTTIEAVEVLDKNGFENIIKEAMQACMDKAGRMKV